MQNEKETLLSLNAKELRSLAKERKIPYWYRMSKADLIDALEEDSDRVKLPAPIQVSQSMRELRSIARESKIIPQWYEMRKDELATALEGAGLIIPKPPGTKTCPHGKKNRASVS